MTKVRGLREDIQLGLALKQQIAQWLLTTDQTATKPITKVRSSSIAPVAQSKTH